MTFEVRLKKGCTTATQFFWYIALGAARGHVRKKSVYAENAMLERPPEALQVTEQQNSQATAAPTASHESELSFLGVYSRLTFPWPWL